MTHYRMYVLPSQLKIKGVMKRRICMSLSWIEKPKFTSLMDRTSPVISLHKYLHDSVFSWIAKIHHGIYTWPSGNCEVVISKCKEQTFFVFILCYTKMSIVYLLFVNCSGFNNEFIRILLGMVKQQFQTVKNRYSFIFSFIERFPLLCVAKV